MKYYIAADGGGTKLFAVLYDQDFNIITYASCGGTNHLFRPKEEIERDVTLLADALIPDFVEEVEALDYSIVGNAEPLIEALQKKVVIRTAERRGEGHTALLTAAHEYGILAQAGTGSDAFLIQPDRELVIGGWGAYLGDEGSGYDIGIKTLKAAIYAYDGRGPATRIYDILMQDWELDDMWDVINKKIAPTPDFRRLIASATRICGKAAAEGDPVAIEIFRDAAEELALQVKTAIRQAGGTWTGPIVTSGGAWKSSPYLSSFFTEIIRTDYPDAVVIGPMFEPIVGNVLLRHKDTVGLGTLVDILKDKFKNYVCGV